MAKGLFMATKPTMCRPKVRKLLALEGAFTVASASDALGCTAGQARFALEEAVTGKLVKAIAGGGRTPKTYIVTPEGKEVLATPYNRRGTTKLDRKMVIELKQYGVSSQEIANQLGASPSAINLIWASWCKSGEGVEWLHADDESELGALTTPPEWLDLCEVREMYLNNNDKKKLLRQRCIEAWAWQVAYDWNPDLVL